MAGSLGPLRCHCTGVGFSSDDGYYTDGRYVFYHVVGGNDYWKRGSATEYL